MPVKDHLQRLLDANALLKAIGSPVRLTDDLLMPRRQVDGGAKQRQSRPQQVEIESPSAPISKGKAAELWGGQMTTDKLTAMLNSGKLRYQRLNRQTFIFERAQIRNLPAPRSSGPPRAN